MSYNSISTCAEDNEFISRIASCAAQEGVTGDPRAWAVGNVWTIASASEIEEAYEYALATNNPNPGGDEGAITDAMILAHVQPMVKP